MPCCKRPVFSTFDLDYEYLARFPQDRFKHGYGLMKFSPYLINFFLILGYGGMLENALFCCHVKYEVKSLTE